MFTIAFVGSFILLQAQQNEFSSNSALPVLVDKNCIDGKFCIEEKEHFYTRANMPVISDLVQQYTPANYMQFIYDVLQRRFPTGKAIIEKAGGQKAVDMWLTNKQTAKEVLMKLPMTIHEIGHGIDKQTPENWYFLAQLKDGSDLAFTTPGMHGKISFTCSRMPRNL
jgi:hypothetical protein